MGSVTSADPCPCCGSTCTACEACAVDPDPECCTPCPTPNMLHVTILAAVASANCSFDTANNHHVHLLNVSLLVGRTFPIPYAGDCCWSDTFDVTAWVRMLQCNGDGTGCGACTPTLDVTAHSEMTITYCRGGNLVIDFHLTGSDTELDNSPDGFVITCENLLPDADPVPCCSGWTATGPALIGTEPMETIAVTSAGVVPC